MLNAKNLGYLIPGTIDPESSECVKVAVPDDDNHRAAFWGALQTLAQWYNWERDPTHAGKDAAAVWAGVITAAHLSIGGLCDVPPDFQIVDCDLQWRANPTDSWISLGNVCGADGADGADGAEGPQGIQGIQGIQGAQGDTGEQGIQGVQGDVGPQGIQGIQGVTGDTGAQGIQGIQGIQGDPGECSPCGQQIYWPPEEPTSAIDNLHVCAGVHGLVVDFLVARYRDTIIEWQLYLDVAATLVNTVIAIVEVVTLGVAELFGVDDMQEFYFNLVTLDNNLILGQITNSANQEEWKTYLYCAIVNSGQLDLTQAIWDDFIANGIGQPAVFGHGLEDFAENYSFETIRSRYNMNALDTITTCTSYDCGEQIPPEAPCEIVTFHDLADWSKYANIPANNQDFAPWEVPFVNQVGVWNEPAKKVHYDLWFASNPFNQTGYRLGFMIDMGVPVDLTHILYSWDHVGASSGFDRIEVNLWLHDGLDEANAWKWIDFQNQYSVPDGFMSFTTNLLPQMRFAWFSSIFIWNGINRTADIPEVDLIRTTTSGPNGHPLTSWYTELCP